MLHYLLFLPDRNRRARVAAPIAPRAFVQQRVVDARKLERELGWKPAETFESGIRKTVRWYLDNTDWVAHVQSGAYRDWVATNYHDRACDRAGPGSGA